MNSCREDFVTQKQSLIDKLFQFGMLGTQLHLCVKSRSSNFFQYFYLILGTQFCCVGDLDGLWKLRRQHVNNCYKVLYILISGKYYKLTSAPCHFPSLKKLEISEICSKAFENISSKLTTLTSLVIESVSQLACLPEQLLQNNTF